MRITLLTLLACVSALGAQEPELPILPRPVSVTRGQGTFTLLAATPIVVDAGTRAVGELLARALAPALGFTPPLTEREARVASIVVLQIDPSLARLGREGYVLEATPSRLTIRGAEAAGVFYGTQTLRQLLPADIFSTTRVEREWSVPAVTIEDAPRFSWRGLMLDPVRHFLPKAEVLKFVDLLALHKMNVLHWHLTDDQGWRLEIKKYPKLTSIGGWRKETRVGHELDAKGFDGQRHGGFYTQADVREVVAYARERFITVVPEIEMPGHAQAAVAAYPELGVTGKPVDVSTKWGVNPYLFNADDATLRFLQDVLTEVMALFPSPFVHVGGDEAIKDQWQASPAIQARIKALGLKNEHELQSWFISQMDTFLSQHGRRLIGWDEILEGGLAPGATVMSWRGTEGGVQAARAGHDVVMSPTSDVYLNYYQTYDPTELLAIGGYVPLDKVYRYEPVPGALSAKEAAHVLGAQGNLWSEYIADARLLEYMAFPRAIALAEVTWTPAARKDFASFRTRLAAHEARLTALGVSFRPIAKFDLESTYPKRPER